GHPAVEVEHHRGDPGAAFTHLEGAGRGHVEALRRMAGLVEAVGQGHAVAGRVGGGDQLLGAGLAARLAGARLPRYRQAMEGAAAGGRDLSVTLGQVPFPDDLGSTFGCWHSPPPATVSPPTF